MIRTGEGLYMTYEEYESFRYTEAEILYVICNDCDHMEETTEELRRCPECEGSVHYEMDIEGCECKGCKETFTTEETFYSNSDHYLCTSCYADTIEMDPKKGQTLAECVREYEEEFY